MVLVQRTLNTSIFFKEKLKKNIDIQHSLQFRGNDFTKLMHLVTLHELQKMHCRNIIELKKIVPEQGVLLENNHGKSEREGRFDFLVHARNGKTIGIEVFSRPTQGKLKEKLSYAKEVDEFVFVLPREAMGIYRKTTKKPFKNLAREKFFCSDFSESKIRAWLLDTKHAAIMEKGAFSELFNTERSS